MTKKEFAALQRRCERTARARGPKPEAYWVGYADLFQEKRAEYDSSSAYWFGMLERAKDGLELTKEMVDNTETLEQAFEVLELTSGAGRVVNDLLARAPAKLASK